MLLSRKYRVDLIDIDKKKVNLINKKSPIKDGRIQSLLNSKKSNISASINFEKLVTSNQLNLALPTDYDEKNNNFDVSLILNTLKKIEKVKPDAIVLIKSTIPIGFSDSVNLKFKRMRLFFSRIFKRRLWS